MHSDELQAAPPGTMEFLRFRLGGLDYGLDAGKVQELRILKSLERFAADGEIISGVAVSRGVIMPIVDMRAGAGAGADAPVAPPAPHTDVIILKLSSCVMGMVVDGVTDVVRVRLDQIAPIPGAQGGLPGPDALDYLIGLAEADGRRLILVDIDKLMSIRRAAPLGAHQAA
ncbi:MAG: chemotaxis protein CheW [Pseudomonadota bacterium]